MTQDWIASGSVTTTMSGVCHDLRRETGLQPHTSLTSIYLLHADAAGLSPKSRDKRQGMIARTKSEAALPGTARNALHGERPEAALQYILDYLSSEALR